MDDNIRVMVVMDIEHVKMNSKLLGGQWRECGRGVSQRMGPIPQPRPQDIA